MKKYINSAALMLMLAVANPGGFSASFGVSSINSELGYSLGVATPLWNKLGYAVQFGQYLTQDQSLYNQITLEAVRRFHEAENFNGYARSGAFAAFGGDRRATVGFKLAIGTEFFTSPNLTTYSEAGISVPLFKSDPVIAQGAAVSVGIRYYF